MKRLPFLSSLLLLLLFTYCRCVSYFSQQLIDRASTTSNLLTFDQRGEIVTILSFAQENITSLAMSAKLGYTILISSYVKNQGRISGVYYNLDNPSTSIFRRVLYDNLQHQPDSLIIDEERVRVYWTAHVPFTKGPSSMEYVPSAYTEFYSAPLQNINGTVITYRLLLIPFRGNTMSNGFVPLSQISIDWSTGTLYMILDVYRKQVWKLDNWLNIPQDKPLITVSAGLRLVLQPKEIPNKQSLDWNNYISAIYADSGNLLFGGYDYIYVYNKGRYSPKLSSDSQFPRAITITASDTKDYLVISREDDGPKSNICTSGGISFKSCSVLTPDSITGGSAINSQQILRTCSTVNCNLTNAICWDGKCECLEGYTGVDCRTPIQ